MRTAITFISVIAASAALLVSCNHRPRLSDEELWVRPSGVPGEKAVWGHKDGIRIGINIQPETRLRGLLFIFTPYLDQPDLYVTNFIAMEPIPTGSGNRRGFSEMEMSGIDGRQGKILWSSDDDILTESDKQGTSRGVLSKEKGERVLSVYVFCEPFANGADVYVRIRFFESRPHEFELSTFARESSVPLDYFIVTSTMGNKERIRNLYLADGIVNSKELWPGFSTSEFASHQYFPAERMFLSKDGKERWVIAAPDEEDPAAELCEGHPWWAWKGKKASQYWHFPSSYEDAQCIVNGRATYFMSQNPLPGGGIAYENFEIRAPFRNGDTFCFGVTPCTPEEIIKDFSLK